MKIYDITDKIATPMAPKLSPNLHEL